MISDGANGLAISVKGGQELALVVGVVETDPHEVPAVGVIRMRDHEILRDLDDAVAANVIVGWRWVSEAIAVVATYWHGPVLLAAPVEARGAPGAYAVGVPQDVMDGEPGGLAFRVAAAALWLATVLVAACRRARSASVNA